MKCTRAADCCNRLQVMDFLMRYGHEAHTSKTKRKRSCKQQQQYQHKHQQHKNQQQRDSAIIAVNLTSFENLRSRSVSMAIASWAASAVPKAGMSLVLLDPGVGYLETEQREQSGTTAVESFGNTDTHARTHSGQQRQGTREASGLGGRGVHQVLGGGTSARLGEAGKTVMTTA